MHEEGRGPRAEGRGFGVEARDESAGPPRIRGYRDIVAWQRGYALARRVIIVARAMPSHEQFGLSLQIRRCAVSVPSNIAEGFGRGSRADYVRFLYSARGSLYELSTQISLALDLEYITPRDGAELLPMLDETERVLWGLIRALQRPVPTSPQPSTHALAPLGPRP